MYYLGISTEMSGKNTQRTRAHPFMKLNKNIFVPEKLSHYSPAYHRGGYSLDFLNRPLSTDGARNIFLSQIFSIPTGELRVVTLISGPSGDGDITMTTNSIYQSGVTFNFLRNMEMEGFLLERRSSNFLLRSE